MNKYVGSEINTIADNHSELIQTLNHYPRTFYAYGRLIKTLHQVIESNQEIKSMVKAAKAQIVNAIIRTKELVPISKAVRIFNISTSTFHVWLTNVKLKCKSSFFGQCNRIYSKQIKPSEVK